MIKIWETFTFSKVNIITTMDTKSFLEQIMISRKLLQFRVFVVLLKMLFEKVT